MEWPPLAEIPPKETCFTHANAGWAALQSGLQSAGVTQQDVLGVVVTHVHADHTGGNAVFQKAAPVIASGNVRTSLAKGNDVARDKPSPPEALPLITFEGEMTLHLTAKTFVS